MKKLICVLSCLLFMSGCSTPKEKELTKYSTTLMEAGFDTFIQFTGYCEDEETFLNYGKQLQKEFIQYNALFDKYNDYEGIHNIKTINDQAGVAPVTVHEDIIELLTFAKEYDIKTNHNFDITLGNLLEVWHTYREQAINGGVAAIPSMEELTEAKEKSGWNYVEIDEENNTVYISNPDVSLDVGAVAKGFACEKVAQSLIESGFTSGIINAGGNVRIIGQKPNQSDWEIGIQIPDPTLNDSLIRLKANDDISVVTSGDYQRYYEYEGEKMHHIIDPVTMMPSRHTRAVTVLTKDSGVADILSTTLFTLSYEDGKALLEQLKNDGLQVEAVWLFDETTDLPKEATMKEKGYYIAYTDGLKDAIIQ